MTVDVERVSSQVTAEPPAAAAPGAAPRSAWEEHERYRAAAERARCLASRTQAEVFDD